MSKLHRLIFSLMLLAACSIEAFAQKDSPFVRYPAINNDGTQIAFTYQGDIWLMNLNGELPLRLTVHEGYETLPKFSPDGKTIAFTGNRFGNNDIFTIPVSGGNPARLTYHSTDDLLSGWTNSGGLLFTTARTFQQIEWDPEFYMVSQNRGTPERIMDAFGNYPTMSPDGRFIAYNAGNCRITREVYKGPANKEVWLFDTKNKKYVQLTDFEGMDIYPNWGNSNTIFYLSAKSGRYNIHKINIDENGNPTGQPVQLTNYADDGIRYFTVSNDGKTIVFEKQDNIYIMPTDGGAPRKIDINFGADYQLDPYKHETFTSDANDYAVSPNGKYSALVIRGEIFVKENNEKKSRSVNVSNSPYYDYQVNWLNDSALVFVSDRDGQSDLYMVRSSDKSQTNIFKSLKHEVVRITKTDKEESTPVVSPDGKKIAYLEGTGKLIIAEINTDGKLSNDKTLLDGWDQPEGIAWSPDSKWLAYSLEDLNFNSEIYIHAADNSKAPVNISMHPKGDTAPFWSADGSKLGFVSGRNNINDDVWFVWLKKTDWQKTKDDWEESEDKADNKDDKKKEDKDTTVKDIVIDFENIYERLVQVTSLPGNESDLVISNDGETFYFVTNRAGRTDYKADQDLHKIKWDGSDLKTLTKGDSKPVNVKLDKEGKYIYYFKPKGAFARIEAAGEKEEGLSYSAKMTIDFQTEKDEIFENAWRYLRDGFYDPDFHGQDWDQLKNIYKPWCMKTSTENDFREIYNYMLGQLNASHMGMYGNGREETQKETTGLLGIDVSPLKDGVLVNRVVPNTPADKEQSKLFAGDIITAVNGFAITPNTNFYSLFVNTADTKILLNVKNKKGESREVVIRPAARLNDELYNEWVKDRRAITEKLSGGRLGYLHIEAMGWESFERFERELTAAGYGKEGIVIDVRYNGGGWTTDYLMTILNEKQHAYTVPRGAASDLSKEHLKFRDHYPFAERLPFFPWTKPSIAICNQNSYSNAEIFSHAYKTIGIGTLVGEPTFGAVISTGGKLLLNGWRIRLPFRAWYVKATDENMELGPAFPNKIVLNPQDYRTSGDVQLEAAVKELLKQIDEN